MSTFQLNMPSIVALFLFFIIGGSSSAQASDVLIVQNVRAKPYAEAIDGFRSVCRARVSEIILSELGDEDISAEIRRKKPDLLVAVGMEALMKIRKTRGKPILYMMVLHPETVLSDEKNITGISMIVPPEKQLSLLRKMMPRVRRVGLVYDPRKSSNLADRASRSAAKSGIELIVLQAKRPEEFPALLRKMKGYIEVYWMLPDSYTIYPEIVEDLILFSMSNRVPIFTFSEKYLQMGALMSVQIDAFKLGRQAGEMAGKILSGTSVEDVPHCEAADAVPSVNLKIAEKMDIRLMNNAEKYAKSAR